ncbi:hypothetical protein IJT10_03785 [bacterium]|nr:hypothetical protein [bacterium]
MSFLFGTGLIQAAQSFSTNLTATATAAQMQASAMQSAQTIYTQVAADAQKEEMNRWKILQDTQTKIQEIQQDVTVNRAKTQDKMFGKWDEYIRS